MKFLFRVKFNDFVERKDNTSGQKALPPKPVRTMCDTGTSEMVITQYVDHKLTLSEFHWFEACIYHHKKTGTFTPTSSILDRRIW